VLDLPLPEGVRRVEAVPVLSVDFFVMCEAEQQQVGERVALRSRYLGAVAGAPGRTPKMCATWEFFW